MTSRSRQSENTFCWNNNVFEKTSFRIFWIELEFGADDHRVQVKETRDSHCEGVMADANWGEFGDRVARRSQIDNASRAASCHSRLLSARRAESRRSGKMSSKSEMLRGLETDICIVPRFLANEGSLERPKTVYGSHVHIVKRGNGCILHNRAIFGHTLLR